MKTNIKKKVLSLFAVLTLCVTAAVLSGCGGGDSGGGNNSGSNNNTNNNTGGSAPDSIAGKTFNGRIGTTTTVWRIVFSDGTGTTGTYSYSENGRFLDSGNYTYTKTGSSTANLTLADGTVLQLTYTGPNNGNYLISKSGETGTFSSN
jgi:hypothetical protein